MEVSKDGILVILKAHWEWKSNRDPWSHLEEPQWESYLPEDNDVIEEAYQSKQKDVDLGGYIISFKEMKQIGKGDKGAQRPVRRRDGLENEETSCRSERYSETESPKGVHKIFGGLGDFLGFFSRRSCESLSFAKLLREIEREVDLDRLNKEIVPLILECLQKELEKEEKSRSELSKKKLPNYEEEWNQKLLLLFQKRFMSFPEFYGQIVKAYTMNTFLFKNSNQYLREENWIEIDNLLPYEVCFCKAFFTLGQAEKNFDEGDNKNIVVLYRGTTLTEAALKSFDLKENTLFSWNSATSTSKKKTVAQKFLRGFSGKRETKKYPVMFIIQVPPISHKQLKYSRYLEVHKYSVFPKEDEVILPPGSVFELEGVTKDIEGTTIITIITIRLKDNIHLLASQGLIMPGAMQNMLMTDKQVKIMFVEGEELCEALKLILGNKLIEEVEIGTCTFDNNSLGQMINILQTVERVKELKFISCSFKDEGEILDVDVKAENFKIPKITIEESNNFSNIFGNKSHYSKFWKYFQDFEISFINSDHLLNFQALLNLTQLTSLKLDFSRCAATTDKMVSHLFSQGLKFLTQLAFLNLNFEQCNQITDEVMNRLSFECLINLTQLTSLELNFAKCSKITDKGVFYLFDKGLRNLIKLQSLNLSFAHCTQITNKAISRRGDSPVLQDLTQLVSLKLNFSRCSKITNEGMNNLSTLRLGSLTLLKLDMSKCFKLTNYALDSLCENLQRLKSLNINFSGCKEITQEGIKKFFSQRLQDLTELSTLKLDFSGCSIIPEEVNRFCSKKIKHLSKLTCWKVNFSQEKENIKALETSEGSNGNNSEAAKEFDQVLLIEPPAKFVCKRIQNSDEERLSKPVIKEFIPDYTFKRIGKANSLLKILEKENEESIFKSLKNLEYQRKIISLSLRFSDCRFGSKKLSEKLDLRELKSLTRLTHLKLDFSGCSEITNDSLEKLGSKGLRNFPHLKLLNLDFSKCFEITDEGFKHLCSQGLCHLPQLVFLSLNLEGCDKVTNQGIYYLSSQALKFLGQLRDLDLNFSKCSKITQEGLNDLYCLGLRHIPRLRSLKLIFFLCWTMEGKTVDKLCSQVLRNSQHLKSLTLNYFLCSKLTDNVITSLSFQGLPHLTGLRSLSLNLSNSQITDNGIKNLYSGLKYLTQLESLSLNCEGSKQITDEGVNNLCYQGLKHLTKLTFLVLNFKMCPKITYFTKTNLLKVLQYFGFTFENLESSSAEFSLQSVDFLNTDLVKL